MEPMKRGAGDFLPGELGVSPSFKIPPRLGDKGGCLALNQSFLMLKPSYTLMLRLMYKRMVSSRDIKNVTANKLYGKFPTYG